MVDDYFAQWCRLDSGENWRERLIVMLVAYFDLGATFDQQNTTGIIGMGGYLGKANDWVRFGRRWRRVLKNNNVEIFHMTDYEARQPPYNWDQRRRISFLTKLLRIIGETALLGIASAVVRRDFDSLTDLERQKFGGVYRYCAATCMGRINHWLNERQIGDAVDYVFELGDEGQGEFKQHLNEAINHTKFRERFRVRSVAFKAKGDAPGLQTGDIAAFEVCKHVPRALGSESRAIRKSFALLLQTVPHVGGFLTLPEMRQFISHKESLPSFDQWLTLP